MRGFPPTSRRRRRDGFTLVEILVATTVLAVVGTVAASCLFATMHAWERCEGAAPGAGDFLAALEADFAACPCDDGFSGDTRSCSFPTLRPQGDARAAPLLRLVRYELAGGTFTRTESPADGGGSPAVFRRGRVPDGVTLSYAVRGPDGVIAWTDSLPEGSARPDHLGVAVGSVLHPLPR